MVVQDDVAGLFATEVEAALAHPFHDIAVADLGALQREVVVVQQPLEPEVGHDRGDHTTALEQATFCPVEGDEGHDLVAVDDLTLLVTDDDPVGVAVESNADVGAVAFDRLGQGFGMGRTAVGVDVQAVGLDAHRADFRAQLIEGGRRDPVAGPVGAVDGDAQALQAQALGEAGLGDLDVAGLGVVDALDPAEGVGRCQIGVQRLIHHRFNLQLDRIRQLVAVGAEKLDAVVEIGVVGGRDHHPDVGAHRAGHHGHARRRQRTEGPHVHPGRGEACDQRRLDHIARQTRVLADDDKVAAFVGRHEQTARREADTQGHLRSHRMGVGAATDAVRAEVPAFSQLSLPYDYGVAEILRNRILDANPAACRLHDI